MLRLSSSLFGLRLLCRCPLFLVDVPMVVGDVLTHGSDIDVVVVDLDVPMVVGDAYHSDVILINPTSTPTDQSTGLRG